MKAPNPLRTASVKIPRRFYDDHTERELPAPGILKSTRTHYWIDALSPDLAELLEDAEFYSSDAIDAAAFPELFGLKSSARATAAAIRKATT